MINVVINVVKCINDQYCDKISVNNVNIVI